MYLHLCSGIYITCIKFKHNMCVAYFNGNGIWCQGYQYKQKTQRLTSVYICTNPKPDVWYVTLVCYTQEM